ncbi:MAG: UDP-N-acetylglucosamine diphosphorylase/glucosamine-1-phosphate N-acetyltransferase, partial [Deltaproteobacteria bacterium]
MTATACVILAAGEGKRMRSEKPKVLHEVCGEPMLHYPVSLAIECGFSPVVVVLSPRLEGMIGKQLVERFGPRVVTAVQEQPLGTAHAVLCGRRVLSGFSGKLAILYGDVPLLDRQDIMALSRAGRASNVAFLTCRLADPAGYGRVVRNDAGEPIRIVEHRDAKATERKIDEVNAGIYLVDAPWVFRALRAVGKANAQGEYYLTDLVELAIRRGLKVRAVQRPGAERILGINDRVQLARAEELLNLRFAHKLMKAGVTIVSPRNTWLGPQTQVGRDTVILPGCIFRGEVKIGSNCTIGPGVVMTDCTVDRDVQVGPYCVMEGCSVERGARIGPFSRLRPGAHIGRDARVGNFVEVKNSTLGRGAKANHLTYLGDAEIGPGVNVGAGTIT